MTKTLATRRRGRIFPEAQWTPAQRSQREVERENFYHRCYPIFDRVRSELITTHYNWFIAIEPDSEDRFLARDLELASLQCKEKYPDKLHYIFQINESGACGTI